MQAWFIFILSSAATAAVPPSLPAVCGAFITSPTGRFHPVTHTHKHARAHAKSLQDQQPVESPPQQRYPISPCSPTRALGTVEGGSGYYGNAIACCSPSSHSCSTAGKNHHYKYCSNLFKRNTLVRWCDTERMSAAYIDHIKYD